MSADSPFGPLRLVANPIAGRGRDGVLTRLRGALDRLGVAHDLVLTERAGDAVALTRAAVEQDGVRFVVAVGGDGTVHEVVNGLVDPVRGARADGLVLGVVPAGSGCDFARSFGLAGSAEELASRLTGPRVRPLDVGTVELTGPDGAQRHVCFANIAEVGYGAIVVDVARRYPRWLGSVRYLFGVFAAARRLRALPLKVETENAARAGRYCNVVVANGRYFGGNMRVAPDAEPDDGRFDVQLWEGRPLDVLAMTGRIKRGRHLGDRRVTQLAGTRVRVNGAEELLVEADGEVLGTTPARFGLRPAALRIKV
jgi:diacylglycerol kinase (ATP)